ncbi:UNVERIFIED_ORG: DNA-binding transcriptional LysR family regulator [Paraburkholderia sediminicola]|nr:DNA-binding transcriptional LysR family regulator [Paraburkholderia sediminicola]
MELRHLRYFVAVAELLNFRKAAERLRISQPPLSAQIHQLEDEVGRPLFERRGGVSLTAEGREFLKYAYQILQTVESAKEAVGGIEAGVTGELRIAFTPSTEFCPFFFKTISEFITEFPHVRLSLQEMMSGEQVERLAEREIDLGIGRKHQSHTQQSVRFTRLISDRLVVAVHATNPLNSQRQLNVSDLQHQSFIMHRSANGGGSHRHVREICAEAGFEPQVAQEAREVTTCIALVASGLGITLVPRSLQCMRIDGVRYLPLGGTAGSVQLYSLRHTLDDRKVSELFLGKLMKNAAQQK